MFYYQIYSSCLHIVARVNYFLLLIFPFFVSAQEKISMQQPNIVFIMSDDHGYQAISAYGYHLNQTPFLDTLAKEGILFDRAFVNNSLCSPSRAAILTGKYSHMNGIKGNDGEVFDGAQETFPKLLQQAGYQTALVGKWHLVSNPTGFDYWNILPGQGDYYNPVFKDASGEKQVMGYVTNIITDKAIDWLQQRDTTKPFCLLVWNKAPHRDWMPALNYLHEFDNTQFPPPPTFFDDYSTRTRAAKEQKMEIAKWLAPNYDLKENFDLTEHNDRLDEDWVRIFGRLTPAEQAAFKEAYTPANNAFKKDSLAGKKRALWKYERYIKDYLRTIQSVDDNVGRIMTYLHQHNLEKNTIVIYSSDQGFYLGEHGWFDKRFMYEESFRTPLIVRWPAVIAPGSISHDMVMNLDIGATLLEAAHTHIPSDMQGKSMLPIWSGQEGDSAWRDYVYYHYYESGGEHNVAKHIGIRTERYKLIFFYENNDWELYDLQKDPNELNNVYDAPGYWAIRQQLIEKLQDAIIKYKDKEMEDRLLQ